MTRFSVRTEAAGYTSLEVSRICGVSRRQLDWWDAQHVISPVRRGKGRAYSQTDLYLVQIISELRKRHIGLQSARAVIALVREPLRRGEPLPRYAVGIEAFGKRTIARLYSSPETVVEALSQQAAGGRVFVVTLPGGGA